ncbi:MAG: hypothetical protein ABW133_07210 [Polyangiaceae bacterium]
MSGSEPKSESDNNGSSNDSNRPSLADFLTAPRPRSVPAPARAEIKTAAEGTDETSDKHTAVTPTAPTTVSDAPPAPRAEASPQTESARASLAPMSGDSAARSLIPVATSDSDAPVEEDEEDTFSLPGTSNPWSTASVRRATFVALLAAAAAVPAWVVFRARGVVPPPDREVSAASGAKIAAPTTLAPTREVEGDDDEAEPAPAASAAVPVAIDPVKGAELKREARRLLESGVIDQGVATARRSIEMNPNDPECYVLLAAGLQDQGRWAESREVFSRCVHKSNNGINAECVYFATSGTLTNR